MAKPNYRHAKKQKEAARKARQDAKQQRKATAPDVPADATEMARRVGDRAHQHGGLNPRARPGPFRQARVGSSAGSFAPRPGFAHPMGTSAL